MLEIGPIFSPAPSNKNWLPGSRFLNISVAGSGSLKIGLTAPAPYIYFLTAPAPSKKTRVRLSNTDSPTESVILIFLKIYEFLFLSQITLRIGEIV